MDLDSWQTTLLICLGIVLFGWFVDWLLTRASTARAARLRETLARPAVDADPASRKMEGSEQLPQP